MARKSTLLAHEKFGEIHAALAAATPIALVAQEFNVSESALYRLKKSLFGKAALQDQAEKARVIDYIEAAADSLRDADAVRRQAMTNNRPDMVLKASLVIERLTKLLALRFAVDGSNTSALLRDGDAVVTALAQVIRQTPGVAADMVAQLHLAGQHDLAGEFEDFSKALENTKNEEIAS